MNASRETLVRIQRQCPLVSKPSKPSCACARCSARCRPTPCCLAVSPSRAERRSTFASDHFAAVRGPRLNDIGRPDRIGAMAEAGRHRGAGTDRRRGAYRGQRSREEHAGRSCISDTTRSRWAAPHRSGRELPSPSDPSPARRRTVWAPHGDQGEVLVMAPAELLAGKILALLDRSALAISSISLACPAGFTRSLATHALAGSSSPSQERSLIR